MLANLLGRSGKTGRPPRPAGGALGVEQLEGRTLPAVTAFISGADTLVVAGDAGKDNIRILLDPATNQLVVRSYATDVARFDPAAVGSIYLDGGKGRNVLTIDDDVLQPATIRGGTQSDILRGGGGPTTLIGARSHDKLVIGPGVTTVESEGDASCGCRTQDDVTAALGISNRLFGVKPVDTLIVQPADKLCFALPVIVTPAAAPALLEQAEVRQLLLRAAGASASNDAIIAIVDRGGRLLGVYVESGVSAALQSNPELLSFAVDGAIAKARTGAFFGNNEAPLTSRTVQFISQTTMTQREIESYPFITDPGSTQRGPGFVAPVGIKNHFPPGVPYTPQVDLFAIEHTNRDSIVSPGPDHLRGTMDDIPLAGRFNIPAGAYNPAIPPEQRLAAPESYGFLSGIDPDAQSRGIATLPGGIPIYKRNALNQPEVVGGIGVFFPGRTGWATEENSALSETFNPAKRDRSFEAEYVAFAALGGLPNSEFAVGAIAGIPPVSGVLIPATPTSRIDLVGITLDLFGPNGLQGPFRLRDFGRTLGTGDPAAGHFLQVTTSSGGDGLPNSGDEAFDDLFRPGTPVPEGWIVPPRDGAGVTAAEVQRVIEAGIAQADQTRAAIRLPLNRTTKMVLAVTDLNGDVVGLYRMPDATVFSIDVAVAKARNVTYYADPSKLQPRDMLPGVAPGFALTNRSFRYVALPRYPEGIDGSPPGPFSILNDGGVNSATGLNLGPPLPASAYQSVQGFDAFNPQSNFHDPFDVANQNGIVFFPGSAPLYRGNRVLIGGYGISGDGVDQDDVVTTAGATGFEPPPLRRIDEVFVRGVRVPYNKFNRNPEGGVV